MTVTVVESTVYPPGTALGIRGFPLAAVKSTDIVGVDFDPHDTPEEHAEIFVVPTWFPFWKGKVLWDGNLSTFRELHIATRGAIAGLRCGTYEDLPKAPVLFEDEGQYYEGYAAIFYDLKRGSQGGIIGGIMALAAGLKAFGLI